MLPTEQLVAQAAQLPALHEVPAPHAPCAFHTVQLLASVPQLSVPLPLHRAAPTVQLVPQVPHAPPLQKLPHCCPACHPVQPWPSATQVSTVVPAQRLAPAVQVLLQVVQLPVTQRVPLAQGAAFHAVQPVSTFQSQVSAPVPTQRAAPIAHAWHELHWPLPHTSP
ncbi:MAG: hypothetical protein H6Q89_2542 [Myxococcaceae bacterium]|nr:hypothetical protein [Myxococcaceae bacterium]